MKKVRLLMAVLTLLGLSSALTANAQSWTGSAPAPGAKVFLYNVGVGKYAGVGKTWGTQFCLSSKGQWYTLSDASSSTLQNGTLYVGWGEGSDADMLYTDRPLSTKTGSGNNKVTTTYEVTFSFSVVSGTTYSISFTKNNKIYYLVGSADGEAIQYQLGVEPSTNPNAQWKLVTETEMTDYFTKVSSDTETEYFDVDGTYLLKAPSFARGDGEVGSWSFAEGTSYVTKTTGGKNINFSPKTNEYTYYIGAGYDSECKYATSDKLAADEELFTANGAVESQHCERYFGGLWTANIHGKGTMSQTINVTTEGWYKIACKGFTTGSAVLYATASNSMGDTNTYPASETDGLTSVSSDAFATYALAGNALKNNTNGVYSHSVLVYVGANRSITFGVKEESNTSGWACFDDFQLTYLGQNAAPYFYFNETNTDFSQLTKQVDIQKKHLLYLQRNLKANQWNSLILPVNLTAEQIKSAFGEGTKLSVLEGIIKGAKYLISFSQVDLSNSSNGLKAGTLYIIKPSSDTRKITDKTFEVQVVGDSEGTKTIIQATESSPVYKIPNVAFTAAPANAIAEQINVPGNDELGTLTFKGTYINQTSTIIPAGSFLLGSDGKWYHTQKKAYAVKGFRTWIEPSSVASSEAKIGFCIDGVEEEVGEMGGVTGIEGIEGVVSSKNSQKLYDLNGRLIRSNGNTEGLAKGIYIVNGKKVVIR